MALIKCPDCKTQISDTADACPRCGCKFKYEYNEMLRLRREIPMIEGMTKTEGGSSLSGGLIVTAIIGFCICALGLWLVGDFAGADGWTFIGLGCIIVGGFVCWLGCALQYDKSEQAYYNNVLVKNIGPG